MGDIVANNKSFFESPQAAAIYKHKLLKGYIPAWIGKVGSTSTGRRVIVYDAYSGPGRYNDEQPGSPELLVDTAEDMAKLRSVFSVFSEKDQGYCDTLCEMLAKKGIDSRTYEVRRGPVEDHIGEVLNDARDLPLFVFLDPYGLTIPFDSVVDVLRHRDKANTPVLQQPKTELLLNFSYEAVRRIAGVIRSRRKYSAKQGQIDALDTALGGDWWHDLARDEPDGWVQDVLEGYADRVGKAATYSYITAPVADSLNALPVYELILFTRHADGIWEMARSMSMARKEWRERLVNENERDSGGQKEFRGLQFDDNEPAWVEEIAANVASILVDKNGFVIEDELGRLLGRTLGLARETHIRKALKLAKESGAIEAVPAGKLQRAYIARK